MDSAKNILSNAELFELVAINNNVFTGNSEGELYLKGEAGACVWEETKKLLAKVEQAAVAKFIASQSAPTVFSLSIAHAEAYIKQLETENDKEYVGRGADAYYHTCRELESWRQERFKKNLDSGPEGSLVEWMMWAQEFMDNFNVPEGLERLASEVEQMVSWLEDNEWAEHVGQTELGKRLESQITRLQCPALAS